MIHSKKGTHSITTTKTASMFNELEKNGGILKVLPYILTALTAYKFGSAFPHSIGKFLSRFPLASRRFWQTLIRGANATGQISYLPPEVK